MTTTLDIVIHVLRRTSGVAAEEAVGADTGLVAAGLSLDSVAVLELIVALEKEFGIELDSAELMATNALATVGSLSDLVDSKVHGGR